MRLATVLTPTGETLPAAAAPDGVWIPLGQLPGPSGSRLEDFLPWIMDHPSENSERLAGSPGPGLPEAALRFLPPVVRPPAFRDFYAFEAHVKTARAKRGLDMPAAWYKLPVFYFSNHNALVGQD